jgi:cytoplasmic iron level regulating protein YaaA (DUF328/UPF0246 family)
MKDWVLLLPPSEGKAPPPPSGPTWPEVREKAKANSFRQLDPVRLELIEAFQEFLQRGHALDRLFELTGEALHEAVEINRSLLQTPVRPASELYTGVLYEALSYKTLKAAERKRFAEKTLIISGLFGVVRPTDLLPCYKLKMGATLGGVVGKLVQYWRRPVSQILRHEVKGKVVWDFLPEQHRRAWDGSGDLRARNQVKFVKRIVRGGVAEYKTISHHSKALKGALVRHLLATDATEPEQLEDFVHPDGYRFSRDLSTFGEHETTLVFCAD